MKMSVRELHAHNQIITEAHTIALERAEAVAYAADSDAADLRIELDTADNEVTRLKRALIDLGAENARLAADRGEALRQVTAERDQLLDRLAGVRADLRKVEITEQASHPAAECEVLVQAPSLMESLGAIERQW